MKQIKQIIGKHPELKKVATKNVGLVRKFHMFLINKLYGIDERKVVFTSFGGKSYSDNPRAISEKLYEMYPTFQIVWLFDNPEQKRKIVPDYVKYVKSNSCSALKELATAKFWVDNFPKSIYNYKSKKQVYIQTWHGDRGFKKILHDSIFVSKNAKYVESELCDLFVSGSDYGDSKLKTAFHYYGQMLKVGCPRNDLLIKNDWNKKQIIKNQLKIKEDTKVLLYAPTLRRKAASRNKLQVSSGIDLLAVIKELEKKTEEEWICLVRAHSAVKGLKGIPNNYTKILDVTSYEDMSDLMLISDFLVIDYSSSAGDFILLDRPVLLFQSDRDEYIKNDRTCYFDLDGSPYMIAKSQEELLNLIKNLDWETIPENCKDILNFYGAIESGKASKKVVEYMISKI